MELLLSLASREIADDEASWHEPSSSPAEPGRAFARPDTSVVGRLVRVGNRMLAPGGSHEADQPSRWVIVGGPGQGKSTIGQFLCQLYRARLLADQPVTAAVPELRQAIVGLLETAGAERIPAVTVARWPLHIPLAAFADDLTAGVVTGLLEFAAARVSGYHRDGTVTERHLREWLTVIPWCVVLDGLDEVPGAYTRQRVMTAISDFRVEAAAADADLLLVATTRPQGYHGDFSPEHFRHLELQPLPPELASRYAERLVRVRYGADPALAANLLDRVRAAAEESGATRWLMGTPLQVTIMTMLLSQIGEAPTDRSGLFGEYYDTIYRRELGKNLTTSRMLREHRHTIDMLHDRAALLLQARGTGDQDTGSRLFTATIDALLDDILADEGFAAGERAELVATLRATTTQRLVFLVGATAEHVAFEVRSLQEYCAARALVDGPDEMMLPRLSAIASGDHWRNVLLLTCGMIFNHRRALRDMVVTFCQELDATDTPLARSAVPCSGEPQGPAVTGGATTRAGAALAAQLLADGVAYGQPRYRTLLLTTATRLLDLPGRAEAGPVAELAARPDLRAGIDAAIGAVLETATPDRRLGALFVLDDRVNEGDIKAGAVLDRYLSGLPAQVMRAHILEALTHDATWKLGPLGIFALDPGEVLRCVPGRLQDIDPLDITSADRHQSTLLLLLFSGLARSTPRFFADQPAQDDTILNWVSATSGARPETMARIAWRSLRKMSELELRWRWLGAVAEFADSPGARTLEAAVSALQGADFDNQTLSRLFTALPWPIVHATTSSRPMMADPGSIRRMEDSWVGGVQPEWIVTPTPDEFFPIRTRSCPC